MGVGRDLGTGAKSPWLIALPSEAELKKWAAERISKLE